MNSKSLPLQLPRLDVRCWSWTLNVRCLSHPLPSPTSPSQIQASPSQSNPVQDAFFAPHTRTPSHGCERAPTRTDEYGRSLMNTLSRLRTLFHAYEHPFTPTNTLSHLQYGRESRSGQNYSPTRCSMSSRETVKTSMSD